MIRKALRLIFALLLLLVIPAGMAYSILHPHFSDTRLVFTCVVAVLLWDSVFHGIVLVYTPGDEGAVVEDVLAGGKFFPLGTGLNPKLPWEKLCHDRKVSIKTRTASFSENFITKDGLELVISCAFTWRPDSTNLRAFFLVDEKTIVQTITDKVKAWLVQKCAANTAEDIRTNLDNTNPDIFCLPKQFESDFVKKEHPPGSGTFVDVHHDFERNFGVEIIQILPSDISYPSAVQDAKNAQRVQEEITAIATKLLNAARNAGDQKYTFAQAVADALILVGKSQSVNIRGGGKGGTMLNVAGK